MDDPTEPTPPEPIVVSAQEARGGVISGRIVLVLLVSLGLVVVGFGLALIGFVPV
jgi:hypothetical protein